MENSSRLPWDGRCCDGWSETLSIGLLIGLRRSVYGPTVEWLVLGMFGKVRCGKI